MTIDQVATSTNLTKGYLSRVERDLVSPSVSTLLNLCDVLSIDVGELLRTSDTRLIRADTAPRINMGGSNVQERLASPRDEDRVQVIHSIVEKGRRGTGGTELYAINADLEILYVMSGRIAFENTTESIELGAGDSVAFDGREPHTWHTMDTDGAELLWVLVPAAWTGS